MEKENLIYHSKYSGEHEVELDIRTYPDNGRIYIGLITNEDGYTEHIGNVTVNIDAPASNYCGYLDTNNLANVENFIREYNLGEFTGLMGRSGYCSYPLYAFNVHKLRELCPEQMAAYERSIKDTGIHPAKERI